MSRRLILSFLSLPFAVALAGCGFASQSTPSGQREPASAAAPGTSSATPQPPMTAKSPGHWVKDARLRVVMDQISFRTSQSPLPKDMPKDVEEPVSRSTEWYFGEAVMLSKDLAASAERIPQMADTVKMTAADRAGFLAEAATLREQAGDLGDAAMGHKVEQMERLLDSINATCVSCHSRYRDFAGQIDLSEAKLRGT